MVAVCVGISHSLALNVACANCLLMHGAAPTVQAVPHQGKARPSTVYEKPQAQNINTATLRRDKKVRPPNAGYHAPSSRVSYRCHGLRCCCWFG